MFFIHSPPGVSVPVTGEFAFTHLVKRNLGEVGVQSEIVSAPAPTAGTSISLTAPDTSVQYQILSAQGSVVVDWTRSSGTVNPGQLVRLRGNVPNSHGGYFTAILTVGGTSANWVAKAKYNKILVAYQYVDDPFTQQQWTDRIAFLKDIGFTRVIAQLNWGGFRQYQPSAYEIPNYSALTENNTAYFMNACGIVGMEACLGKICHQLSYQAQGTYRNTIYSTGRGAKSAIWFNNAWNLVATTNGADYGSSGYNLPMMFGLGNTQNRDLMANVCDEMATKFGPKEIVLDYIRHNGARMDTSLEQLARFNTFTGAGLTFVAAGNRNQWPEVVLPAYVNPNSTSTGSMYNTFKIWQADWVSSIVAQIRAAMPSSVGLGAAVFCGGPTNTGTNAEWYAHAQDWPNWMRDGDLQTAYPMNYDSTVAVHEGHMQNPDWTGLRDQGKQIVSLVKNDYTSWTVPGTLAQWNIKADQIDKTINQYGYAGAGVWQVMERGGNLPSSAGITVCDNLVPNFSSYCRAGYAPPF